MGVEKRAVSIPTKIAFGSGSSALATKENAFDIFLLFFYTQIVGLSGTLAGTVILISLVVDAISDPAVGYWSDNIRTKWGSRHPFMYASVVPLAVSFILLFNPPPGMGQMATFSWMLAFAILVRSSITLFSVPSISLVAEMTSNYTERTSLISFRMFFGWLGGISVGYFAYSVIFAPSAKFADGRFDPSAYQDYAFFGAAIMIIAILCCTAGTHHLIPRLHKAPSTGISFRGFVDDIKTALSTKPFLVLFIAVLITAIANGYREVTDLYMYTYFWGFSTDNLSSFLIGRAIAALMLFASIKYITARFGKRRLIVTATFALMIAGPLPVVLALLGLLPNDGGDASFYVLFVQSMVLTYFAIASMITAISMVADSIDQNELETGKQQSGLFFSAINFSGKATSGLGGFVAGVTLDLISFPKTADVSSIPAETLESLGVASVIILTSFWAVALFTISRYSLTKEKHAEIVVALEKQRKLRG